MYTVHTKEVRISKHTFCGHPYAFSQVYMHFLQITRHFWLIKHCRMGSCLHFLVRAVVIFLFVNIDTCLFFDLQMANYPKVLALPLPIECYFL